MQVRKPDGTTTEVDDGYILRDGEALLVPAAFMDARAMIHDGNGHPVGQRPGFLVNDDDRAVQATRDAYAAYDAEIGNRWQSQRWQSQQSKPAPSKPQVFDSQDAAETARAAAYRQYDEDISARWRR